MADNLFGVVIPTAETRLNNLVEVVKSLARQKNGAPDAIVVVCDGFDSDKAEQYLLENLDAWPVNVYFLENEKHVAGTNTMQPKNAGAKFFEENFPEINYYWFVDSDIIMSEDALWEYKKAEDHEPNRICIGPYEWLPAGIRHAQETLYNDPRWEMFREFTYKHTSVGELNFALANFGGNVVYPKDAFIKVGGFWNELSAGRVEDGEMGLRCASYGIPMCVVSKARGWHLDHPTNHEWKLRTNAVEVPKINERFPEVESQGIVMVDEDGKRFDFICEHCGEQLNTWYLWSHRCH